MLRFRSAGIDPYCKTEGAPAWHLPHSSQTVKSPQDVEEAG